MQLRRNGLAVAACSCRCRSTRLGVGCLLSGILSRTGRRHDDVTVRAKEGHRVNANKFKTGSFYTHELPPTGMAQNGNTETGGMCPVRVSPLNETQKRRARIE